MNYLEIVEEEAYNWLLNQADYKNLPSMRMIAKLMARFRVETKGRIYSHIPPDKETLEKNKTKEPEGERIRQELENFLKRNKIVGIMMDTEHHCITIDSAKLPPQIKPILTCWGSIYIRDEQIVKSCKDLNKKHRCPTDCYPLKEKK